MRHAHPPSLCAAAAIAAALTLGSTPATAQEATPSLDLESLQSAEPASQPATPPVAGTDATAPAPTPTVVLPEPVPSPAVPAVSEADSAPLISAEAPTASAATESRSAAAERTAPSRTARAEPSRASTPVAPATDAGNSTLADSGATSDGDAAEPFGGADMEGLAGTPVTDAAMPGETNSAPVAAAAAADAQEEDPFSIPEESIVALLGVLGLGAAGFMAMRSRRRRREHEHARDRAPAIAAAKAFDADRVADPELDPMQRDEPLTAIPDELAVRGSAEPEPVKPAPAAAPALAPAVAAFPGKPYVLPEKARQAPARPETAERPEARPRTMPQGQIPTGEARQELLQQMVAAAPDEANPFTSARARRKRARIILQHRETLQHNQQGSEPFDWHPYKPTTKSRTPSSPPLVPA